MFKNLFRKKEEEAPLEIGAPTTFEHDGHIGRGEEGGLDMSRAPATIKSGASALYGPGSAPPRTAPPRPSGAPPPPPAAPSKIGADAERGSAVKPDVRSSFLDQIRGGPQPAAPPSGRPAPPVPAPKPAVPPPPPAMNIPPPPAINAPPPPPPGERAAPPAPKDFLSQIQKGAKLKKVKASDIRDASAASGGAVVETKGGKKPAVPAKPKAAAPKPAPGDFLSQIQAGAKLNKVKKSEIRDSSTPASAGGVVKSAPKPAAKRPGPPPPPPAGLPPPPPLPAAGGTGGAAPRPMAAPGDFLSQIQKGAKLKKVKKSDIRDASSPAVAGGSGGGSGAPAGRPGMGGGAPPANPLFAAIAASAKRRGLTD